MRANLQRHARKLRFALVGSINTLIDFGILFGLVFLGVDKYIGNYVSTGVAFLFSFFANRSFTFKSTGAARRQFIPFVIVTLAGLWIIQPIIIALVSTSLDSYIVNQELLLLVAKAIATIASLVWNYVLYAKFVFTERKP